MRSKLPGWNPGRRVFVNDLSADPLGWLAGQLADLDALLEVAGVPPTTAGPEDARDLREAVPEIVDAARRLLGKVRSGELGNPPPDTAPANGAGANGMGADSNPVIVRSGWL